MPINIVATAHGTNSPDGRSTIESIIENLRSLLSQRLGPVYHVYEAYVDVQFPTLDEVLEGLHSEDQTIILPLLLSTGYHTQVDMRDAAKESGISDIAIAAPLGPSPLMAQLMHHRLIEKGWRPGDTVVMAGAGSSRTDGQEAVARQCAMLSNVLAQEVTFGFIADISPTIEEIVAEAQGNGPIFVANYLLGRGFFDQKLKKLGHQRGAHIAEPLVVPGDQQSVDVICQCALDSLGQLE